MVVNEKVREAAAFHASYSPLLEPTKALILGALVTALVYVSVSAARWFRRIRHMRKVSADIPGPPALPIIGNALDLMSGGEERIYENCVRLMNIYGATTKVWLGPELVVTLADPRDVEFVCTSQTLIDKSPFYKIMEPLLGLGLSCLGAPEIRRHRKIVQPSLHLNILHDFLPVFVNKSRQFAEHLEAHADSGEVFDVSPFCVHYSLGSALETIMTADMEEDDPVKKDFANSVQTAMDLFMFRIFRPWFLDDRLFRISGRHLEYSKTMNMLNGFTERLIAKKRQKQQTVNIDDQKKRKRQAFLDKVLGSEDGAALNDLELRDEVKTLLCTGFETTASTLVFLFKVLSLRQDIQEKVVQELDNVFGEDPDRPLTVEDLPHLDYLERVIKETLRMFPVLPFFTRKCPHDMRLPSGHTVPAGAHLTFFLPYLHNDPNSFPDPSNFDPDRFLPENVRGRHPFSYIPFSAGPRNCVGQRYAMMLLKTELSTLLRRYRILPPPGPSGPQPARLDEVPIKVTLVISVKGGVKVRVERRQRSRGGGGGGEGSGGVQEGAGLRQAHTAS